MYGPHADDYGTLATMSDAHSEWHRNAGVPMGQPGCPQDACDPGWYDDEDYVPQQDVPAVVPASPWGENVPWIDPVPADSPWFIAPTTDDDPPF